MKPVFLVLLVLTHFHDKQLLLLVSRKVVVVVLSCLENSRRLLRVVSLKVFSLKIGLSCWLLCVSDMRSSKERARSFKALFSFNNVSQVRLGAKKFSSATL